MQRRTLGIVAALLAVYLIWGSTYLAIHYAVQTMPPFLMASARWIIAGGVMYAWRRLAGDPAPTLRQWQSAIIIGIALIFGGNGIVSWAQQWVPSGLTALLIAVVPAWIAIMVWIRSGTPPTVRTAAGIILGLAGVALLFAPVVLAGMNGASAFLLGTLAILVATLSWAGGSLYSRTAVLPKSTLLSVAIQMLAGGAFLALVGLVTGEAPRIDLAGVTTASWLAFAFLVVFGSIVAFSAYIWLWRVVRAELVATYAFVNPIVAVILGTLIAKEPLTNATLIAAALVVVGVALVVTGGRRPERPAPLPPSTPPTAAALVPRE